MEKNRYVFGVYKISLQQFQTAIVEAEDSNEARKQFNIQMGFIEAPVEGAPFQEFYWEKEIVVTEPGIVYH